MKRISLFILFLLTLPLLPPLYGQSESKSLERLAQEQQNIRQRLDNITRKMDRLIRKNELEGRQRRADLIRQARAEITNRSITKRIDDLDAKIREAQLTVGEEQSILLKDLEDIFAILQDRSDLERLEEALATYAEGLKRIGQLIDEQDQILTETQRMSYEEGALIDASLKELREILEEQQNLNAKVSKGANKNQVEKDWWSIAREIDDLVAGEESLASETFERLDQEGGEGGEEREHSDLAKKQDRLKSKLEELEEKIREMHEKASEEGTVDPLTRETLQRVAELGSMAREEMESAAAELRKGDLSQAWSNENDAAQRLREASQEMSRSGESAFREQRRESFEQAGRQDVLKQKMEDLNKRLNRLERLAEEGAGETSESQQAGMQVQQEMAEARDRLREGRPDQAEQPQANAVEGLNKLQDLLEEKQSEASQSSSSSLSEAERKERMQELAQRQKGLEERTRDLARRLRDLPDRRPVQSLSDAADNMAGASEELNRGEGEEAEVDEEEAKKHLEKAKQAMQQEENKYQNIRQQEVLFRVQQALEKLKEEQDAINADTTEFDLAREGARRLSRRQRKILRGLAQREAEVRAKTTEVIEKIQEDDSTVFSWVLERIVEDLNAVEDFLKKGETGAVVQTIQSDISDRYAELIEAMKQELKRRQEAESDPSETQQQPQPNPLIPPVAELLMIKRMEENALRRLENFIRLNPDILEKSPGPMEEHMLNRLGHRHASITELFDKMVERLAGPPVQGMPGESEEEK